jgi:hypothetical protein
VETELDLFLFFEFFGQMMIVEVFVFPPTVAMNHSLRSGLSHPGFDPVTLPLLLAPVIITLLLQLTFLIIVNVFAVVISYLPIWLTLKLWW